MNAIPIPPDPPLRDIPRPRTIRAALAKTLREARLLRRQLRLSQAADEERRQQSSEGVARD
ncbi:MAG TPA: hypothetical protein VF278_23475 [Pirellulales bacterium]